QDLLETKLDVIHKKPRLVSNTAIKAIVYDEAKFDMIGNLVIETGAKFTDAYLRIDVLLMNDEAKARAVPSLEITEDDVKGGHGATVGQVDLEQLFYLQSRGIEIAQAEQILVEGFVQELLDKVQSKQDLQKLKSILK
ncbi:SufD family Fe-S cluster assembly protein, partial [Candidatus Dojkabacteria bacterium]|nr:SufD family Fe-S cluster assembly protein [Candidatus Dojkabacteria bacterium]